MTVASLIFVAFSGALLSHIAVQAYFIEKDSLAYKWWITIPEYVNMLNASKHYLSSLNTIKADGDMKQRFLLAMNETSTGVFAIRGDNSNRFAHVNNFSRLMGFTGGGYEYVEYIDYKSRNGFTYHATSINKDHWGRLVVMEGHIFALRRFLQTGLSNAIIFEDDVTPMPGYTMDEIYWMMAKYLNMFEQRKWDIFYAGFCFTANGTINNGKYEKAHAHQPPKLFVPSVKSLCTHAYMVSRASAKLFEVELTRRVMYAKLEGLDSLYAQLICKFGMCHHYIICVPNLIIIY